LRERLTNSSKKEIGNRVREAQGPKEVGERTVRNCLRKSLGGLDVKAKDRAAQCALEESPYAEKARGDGAREKVWNYIIHGAGSTKKRLEGRRVS